MAGEAKTLQKYCSQTIISMTESAAGTLTFTRLETGIAPLERIGWVLHKIIWRIATGTFALMTTAGDSVELGVTISDNMSSLADTNPAVLKRRNVLRADWGTAGSGQLVDPEFVDDFSMLPGGGLLMLPNPVYGAIQGSGLASAATAVARLYFSQIQMSQDDYFNLVQSRQVLVNS